MEDDHDSQLYRAQATQDKSIRKPGIYAHTPAPATRSLSRGLLARLPVIPFDTVTARIHARLSAELASNETAVGPHDLIIAAIALTKGYIITTRDERSFPRIPGLAYQRC